MRTQSKEQYNNKCERRRKFFAKKAKVRGAKMPMKRDRRPAEGFEILKMVCSF